MTQFVCVYVCAALIGVLVASSTVRASLPPPPAWPQAYTLVWSEEIPDEDVVVQVTDIVNAEMGAFRSVRASPRGSSTYLGNNAWGLAMVINNNNGTAVCSLFKGVKINIPAPAPLMRGNFTYVDDVFLGGAQVGHWRWTIQTIPGKPIFKVGLYADRTTGVYKSFRNVGGLGGWFNAPYFNYSVPDSSNFEMPESCQNASTVTVMTEENAGAAVPQSHHISQTFDVLATHAEHISRHDATARGYSLGLSSSHAGRAVSHYQHGLKKPLLKADNVWTPTKEQMAAAPQSWDWRTFGFVTNIRDQGSCGSCWAFSTAASLEVAYAIQANTSVNQLSPQMILDCTPLGTGIITAKACYGGWQPTAMDNIIVNGIAYESNYPYEGVSGACYANTTTNLHGLTSYVQIHGEDAMLTAVPNGPIVVIVEVSNDFFLYQSGILDDPLCGDRLDHGVVVVGYGQNATGTPYWIIKNSFGVAWGEAGYIRIIRNKGMCGLGNYSWQPILGGSTR